MICVSGTISAKEGRFVGILVPTSPHKVLQLRCHVLGAVGPWRSFIIVYRMKIVSTKRMCLGLYAIPRTR